MSLDNFRNRTIIWDTVNKDFPQPIQIMQGDVNARTLLIKIVDNGVEIDLTGHSLKLTYQYTNNSNSGLIVVPPKDLAKGEFLLVIPTEMTATGVIEANLILLNKDKEQVIVSKNLTFISDNSTVTDLAQEVNNNIDDFTKLLLGNMPQALRSELNDLHAQTESNKRNIELKAEQSETTQVRGQLKNLINKETAIPGFYVSYLNGKPMPHGILLMSEYVALKPNTTYTLSGTKDQFALYGIDKEYKSGNTNNQKSARVTFTTGSDVYYGRFSMRPNELSSIQLEEGDRATSYKTYGPKVSLENIDKSGIVPRSDHLIIVSKDGSGDYTTVTEAVANASDGYTILVMPGVYDKETVRGFNKDITIMGLNKETTIIKNDDGNKMNVPIEINVGHLIGLTVETYFTEGHTVGTNAYAIHIDHPSSRDRVGAKLTIDNCTVGSEVNSAIGIGLWKDYEVVIRNSEIYGRNPDMINGALYFHNAQEGGNGQKITIDNCRVKSLSKYALNVEDVSWRTNGRTDVSFYNNIFYSEVSGLDCVNTTGAIRGSAFAGEEIFKTPDSFGNNVPKLNA